MNTPPDSVVLSLFEEEARAPQTCLRDRLRKVEWSYSKRNELEQCPRRFYFDYYGTAKRRAKNEPQKVFLQSLKQLHNRHERAGQILHFVIAQYFRTQNAEPLDESGMVRWALNVFTGDLEHSKKAGRNLTVGAGRYPAVQLLEFFHGEADAGELCEAAQEKLLAALRTFARSEKLARIRKIRGHSSIRVERRFKLTGLSCRVAGIVDFAANTQANPGIVDWKIGTPTSAEDDSLQLAVYALWGAMEFGMAPETVRIFKAYLGSDDLQRFRCTTDTIEKAKRRIGQDALRLLETVEYGNSGRAEAFTACAQPRVCALCRYLTACKEGMEAVYG
jgi:PD-(D/E)XK nuclease superfamily